MPRSERSTPINALYLTSNLLCINYSQPHNIIIKFSYNASSSSWRVSCSMNLLIPGQISISLAPFFTVSLIRGISIENFPLLLALQEYFICFPPAKFLSLVPSKCSTEGFCINFFVFNFAFSRIQHTVAPSLCHHAIQIESIRQSINTK